MSIIGSNILAGAAGSGVSAYEIEQSLRFDGSSYLSWTPSSAGNRATWTYSVWLKLSKSRATAGHDQCIFSAISGSGGSDSTQMSFNLPGQYAAGGYDDGLTCGLYSQAPKVTPNRYRDYSAWLHVVITRDQGNATLANSLRFYVNNVRVDESAYINLLNGTTTIVNSNVLHRIGEFNNYNRHFEGYMAEINFIDGTTVSDATDFGEYDDNGVWRPKRYTGTYGTNGFYLKFDPSATNGIGHDHSGNGNNFTASGFTTSGTGTDVMSDTPTTNWATVNPLQTAIFSSAVPTITNGNLVTENGGSGWSAATGTIAVSSGKWYWEYTCSGVTASEKIRNGVYKQSGVLSATGGDIPSSSDVHTYASDGTRWNGSSFVSYGATYTSGDTIGVALDLDAGTLVFYKNNTSQGTAYTGLSGTYSPYFAQSTDPVSTVNFGQRAFAYTPPSSDFKPLNTSNLPAPTVKDGSKNFNTVLYTGTGTTNARTDVGFQPDFVWIKERSGTDSGLAWHALFDAVRGNTKALYSNETNSESTGTAFSSFDSSGFTLGLDTTQARANDSGDAYVAWNWKANGSGSSNTDGSITSTVSANPSAGFSIVSYTGTGSAATVGHGLGVAPSMVIVKNRDSAGGWRVYHSALSSASKYLVLETTAAEDTANSVFNGTAPTSSVFSVGDGTAVNNSGDKLIAYCFAEVEGYSKFGSYTGNGSSDGPFVYCGFRPAWILIKRTDTTSNWIIYDSKRDSYNPEISFLLPNSSQAESVSTGNPQDFLSNGIKFRNANADRNASGGTYIFAAFSENPFGGSGVSPATAR